MLAFSKYFAILIIVIITVNNYISIYFFMQLGIFIVIQLLFFIYFPLHSIFWALTFLLDAFFSKGGNYERSIKRPQKRGACRP